MSKAKSQMKSQSKSVPSPKIHWDPEVKLEMLRNAGDLKRYSRGVQDLLRNGLVKPCGERVLLRAVTTADINADSGLIIGGVERDPSARPVHVVFDIDPTIKDKVPFDVGHHVLHTSAAADVADPDHQATPWVLVHWEDIIAYWQPPGEMDALDG